MDSESLVFPLRSDDRCKIFLSNLDGRVSTEDLHRFFERFGRIEHVESWSSKSAIILYAEQQSVDRVLKKFRKCQINHQEIFIRRIRSGPNDRAYQDSPILMIFPSDSIDIERSQWTEENIRRCLIDYENDIEKIHLASNSFTGWIYFRDYDSVDRLLLQLNVFRVDGIIVNFKRAKNEENRDGFERLVKMNQTLKRQIKRQYEESQDEIQSLQCRIIQLKNELALCKSRRRSKH